MRGKERARLVGRVRFNDKAMLELTGNDAMMQNVKMYCRERRESQRKNRIKYKYTDENNLQSLPAARLAMSPAGHLHRAQPGQRVKLPTFLIRR